MSVESALERLEALLGDMRNRIERMEERLKPEPLCFSFPAAAERLGVGLTKLKQMVKAGQLRATKEVGGVPMISMTELVRVSTPAAEQPKVEAAHRKAAWTPVKRKRG